jgi:hypothetical protein
MRHEMRKSENSSVDEATENKKKTLIIGGNHVNFT